MEEQENIWTEEEPTQEPIQKETQEDLPGYLNDEPQEDEWTIQADSALVEDPEFARRLELHQQGVNKLVERAKEYEAQAQQRYQPYIEIEQALDDPDKARLVLQQMQDYVAQKHGTFDPDTSRYGLDFATDDKVVDTATERAAQRIKDELKEELALVSSLKAERTARNESQRVTPELQKEFGAWVSPEMVQDAALKRPDLNAKDAFLILYAKDIAKQASSYAESRVTHRKGVPDSSAPTKLTPSDFDELGFRTNVSMAEIFNS